MPELSFEEMQALFEELKQNAVSLTLNVSEEVKQRAIQESDNYLKNGNKCINDMIPLSIYYIISKLTEKEQINFINKNIKYIQEHDDDIFLYTLVVPKSLSYYFSFNVLKELRNIDINIFKKVLRGNFEGLFYNFSHDDYYKFYNEFYDDVLEISNTDFVNIIHFHNRCCYENINVDEINDVIELQKSYNREFINYLLDKYKSKIDSFNSRELLTFMSYIEDEVMYKEFVSNYHDKLNIAFRDIAVYDLTEYLGETSGRKQEILISNFFENIIKKQDIRKIIYKIRPRIIISLYKQNKEVFNALSVNDWIKVCAKARVFNNEFKVILDTFDINDIEELFDTKFYISYLDRQPVAALKYVEMKYRNSIQSTGVLHEIDDSTSIFSDKYLKNLCELREMFKNNSILKSDEIYKKHLFNFFIFLKKYNIITDFEKSNFQEVERLFYRIVMGQSITIVYEISNVEEIALCNRLGNIEFDVSGFTVDQIKSYNVKQHKQLYKKFENDEWAIKNYKKLILKLMFMIGFNNTKNLLDYDDSLPVLEHLIGNVDVTDVKFDDCANPQLSDKLINLLFSDKDNCKIKEMLCNKDCDLYKYFPRILNEWEMIVINDKGNSLKEVIEFLKSDEITLSPKYYRLEGLFKLIGCKNSIVNETLLLHDQMLNRVSSTIPSISGNYSDYSYELLRLDDAEGLVVGNKTDCCFTVLGNGYSCLNHALTCSNGRILVIKKGDELLAHSWVWRNGDLLCLDNIEISKKIDCVDFFDVYLKFADELLKISYQNEGEKNCIKNVTIGFTNFDKEIKGVEEYPCLIANSCNLQEKDFGTRLGRNRKFVDVLPQPIEKVNYSDSQNVQYLIRGEGDFNLGQSYFMYQDDRNNIMHFVLNGSYDTEYLDGMNKKLNALRYMKAENENTLDSFISINVQKLKELYCNDDWYVMVYDNDEIEVFNNSKDSRAKEEIESVLLNLNQQLNKM